MEDMERSLAEAMELGNSLYLENDADADSALHRIQRLNRGIEWAKKLAEQQKQKIDLWLEQQIANRQEAISSQKNLLQLYAEERLKNSKRKSVSLPNGKFGFRKSPAKFQRDEATLLEYAEKELPDCVKIKKSVDWATLKKGCTVDGDHLISQDGEIIPGVTVEQQPDKFYTEVG